MSYKLYLEPDARDFLDNLDDKSKRICKDNLQKVEDNPFPGQGIGDKEKVPVAGKEVFRLHIGRTLTAFYYVLEEEKQVRVVEIMPIDEAHEKYGY